jgi:hypothetical protein
MEIIARKMKNPDLMDERIITPIKQATNRFFRYRTIRISSMCSSQKNMAWTNKIASTNRIGTKVSGDIHRHRVVDAKSPLQPDLNFDLTNKTTYNRKIITNKKMNPW